MPAVDTQLGKQLLILIQKVHGLRRGNDKCVTSVG